MRALSGFLLLVGAIIGIASARAPDRVEVTLAQEPPRPVRIIDSGVAVAAPLPDPALVANPRSVMIVLLIENPDPELAAEGVMLTAWLRDGQGRRVISERFDISQLLPGEHRALVRRLLLPAAAADAIARDGAVDAWITAPSRWRRVSAAPSPAVQLTPSNQISGSFSIAGLGVNQDLLGVEDRRFDVFTPVALATVTNPIDAYVAGVDVSAVAFDAEGRIIGGGQRTLALGPLEAAPVSVGMVVTRGIDAIAWIEVTAALPYIDLAPYER